VGTSSPPLENFEAYTTGELWVDTSGSNQLLGVRLKVWTGLSWEEVVGASSVTSVFVPPTSPVGLPVGAVWNNNGALEIKVSED